MKTSDAGSALLCVGGMVIVGSSVSLSQLILDYPALTGQAARYALAAAALFAIAHRFPRLGAGDPYEPMRDGDHPSEPTSAGDHRVDQAGGGTGRGARHRPNRPTRRELAILTPWRRRAWPRSTPAS